MIKSSNLLLNVRLCLYGCALLHLIFAAIAILPIDMSNDEDPKISVYIRVRWKLLTCWFNLLSIAYLPIALFCDWKEKKGEWDKENVRKLRKIRDFVMTSILFPTTMYSDYFFWRMWSKDPALIAPVAIFKYLPHWAHHSLHTVSGAMVVLDLLFLPRKRPKSILPGLMGLLAFCSLYSALLSIAYLPIALFCDWKEKKGEWDKENVRKLRKIRDFVMTSILFPTTMYSDYFFWRMWSKDPALIAPVAIFKYLPHWAHHSLHTVSGAMVVLDLLFLPRKRPKSILPGLMGLLAFCSLYSAVLVTSYYSGEVVYSFLEIFSRFQLCLLGLLALTEHVFFYTLQWCIIDLVWGRPRDTIAKKLV